MSDNLLKKVKGAYKDRKLFLAIDLVIGLAIGVSAAYGLFFDEQVRVVERQKYQLVKMNEEKILKEKRLVSDKNLLSDTQLIQNKNQTQGIYFTKPEQALNQLRKLFDDLGVKVKYHSVKTDDTIEFYYGWMILLEWEMELDESFSLLKRLSRQFDININQLEGKQSSVDQYKTEIELNFISLEQAENLDELLLRFKSNQSD